MAKSAKRKNSHSKGFSQTTCLVICRVILFISITLSTMIHFHIDNYLYVNEIKPAALYQNIQLILSIPFNLKEMITIRNSQDTDRYARWIIAEEKTSIRLLPKFISNFCSWIYRIIENSISHIQQFRHVAMETNNLNETIAVNKAESSINFENNQTFVSDDKPSEDLSALNELSSIIADDHSFANDNIKEDTPILRSEEMLANDAIPETLYVENDLFDSYDEANSATFNQESNNETYPSSIEAIETSSMLNDESVIETDAEQHDTITVISPMTTQNEDDMEIRFKDESVSTKAIGESADDQSQQIGEHDIRTIHIPIAVPNKESKLYTISFNTTQYSVYDAAMALCTTYLEDFELNQETLVSNCVKPVEEYIQSTFDKNNETFLSSIE